MKAIFRQHLVLRVWIILAIFQGALAQQTENVEALQKQVMELSQKGKYEQAIPVSKQALKFCEKALRPEHPSTAASLNNLAVLCESMGNCIKAEPLYRRAVKTLEKVLSPEHPDTVQRMEAR